MGWRIAGACFTPGPGPRIGWGFVRGSGPTSRVCPFTLAAARRRPGPGATVGDRAAPGVGEREAPSVASAGGEGAGQIAGLTRVEWPVTTRVAGCVGHAEPRGQRHREIHGPAGAGGGVYGPAGAGGGVYGPAEAGGRSAVPLRPGEGSAVPLESVGWCVGLGTTGSPGSREPTGVPESRARNASARRVSMVPGTPAAFSCLARAVRCWSAARTDAGEGRAPPGRRSRHARPTVRPAHPAGRAPCAGAPRRDPRPAPRGGWRRATPRWSGPAPNRRWHAQPQPRDRRRARDLVGHHHGPGQVDVPGGERLAGQRQAAQGDGKIKHPVRGAPG
jgi:hypothetical protein